MNQSDQRQLAARAEAARLELMMAAAGAERRNRPRVLVVLAVLLIIGAGIYAATQFSARSAAVADLVRQRERVAVIDRLSAEIQVLRERESQQGVDPDPRVAATLERLADEAGFKRTGPISDAESSRSGTMRQKKYTARAANQDPVALLRWLQRAEAEVRGLEIARLSIRPTGVPTTPAPSSGAGDNPPGSGGYNVDIDFTRWEKEPVAR